MVYVNNEYYGEIDIPWDIITEPFNNVEQNSSLKILIRCVFGNDSLVGEGLAASHSLLTLKKATRSYDFQSNEPYLIRIFCSSPPFCKIPYAPAVTYNPGLWRVVSTLLALLDALWTIVNKIVISHFDRMRLGKKGCQGGGASCPPLLLTTKKELELKFPIK